MQKLTLKQMKVFEFIRTHSDEHGYAPTLRELCEYMGYKAVGSAQDVIASLRKKGYIITPNKQTARSLALTDRSKEFYNVHLESLDDSFSVPRLGSVPAGVPIESIEDFSGAIRISTYMLPRWAANSPEKLFALQAKGESMVHAGILDGDWLIVFQQSDAPSGTIVVAADIEGSSTVKRLMLDKSDGWYLKPENPAFKNRYAKDEPFTILGRVVALQRTLADTFSTKR